MAATFDVKLDRGGSDGAPGSKDTVTNLRFRTDDTNTQDTTNPIPIVTGQTKRSFWRHIYLKCTGAPATKCDNFKFYTDGGGFGTGITVYVGNETPTNTNVADTGYEVATGVIGDSGDELVANHGSVTGKTDVFTYTSGSSKTVSCSEGSNQIDAVNEETDYIILQMDVADTASPGTLPQETFTFQYDEI